MIKPFDKTTAQQSKSKQTHASLSKHIHAPQERAFYQLDTNILTKKAKITANFSKLQSLLRHLGPNFKGLINRTGIDWRNGGYNLNNMAYTFQ